jgi:hypothetical protein
LDLSLHFGNDAESTGNRKKIMKVHPTKSLGKVKETVNKVKRQPKEWGKYLVTIC